MPLSAWLMFIFGCVVLYGGLILCIAIAIRKGKHKDINELPKKRVTGRRLWLFRVIALTIIPALLLILLELVLRVAGYGFPAHAMCRYQENGRVFYCDNVKFSWRFFPKEIAREFNPFKISASKSEDSCRIFVLGASAAQGEPDGAYGFGRFLKVMLQDRYPGVNFEVIIAATAAINSHVVLDIAKDCAKHEPDLFVVYLGNNEVTGPYGAGTVFSPLSPNLSMIRMGIAFKATRLGQLLTDITEWLGAGKSGPKDWRGLEMFLEKQVRADDRRLEMVYSHFRKNLEDILRVSCATGAKTIVCTVGSNLKDSPPFASLHRLDWSEQDRTRWENFYTQAMEEESAGRYAKAVESYLAAAEIDGSFADLQFRLGRCYRALQDYDSAKRRYIQARDLDTLRFRADTRINEIIRRAADSRTGQGVYMVDAVATFESNSPYGMTGNELFCEHVHLNFTGNYLLARTVFETVDKLLPPQVTNHQADHSLALTEAECAERLAYTQWDRSIIADEVLKRFITKPPFTNQLYHQEQVRIMMQKCDTLKATLNPQTLQDVAAQYRQAIQNAPEDLYLRWKYGMFAEELKDYKTAAEQFQVIQRSIPHSYVMYNALGSLSRQTGNLHHAIDYYLTAIRIKPTCGEAHYYLGWIYQKQNRMTLAEKHYAKAIQIQPDNVVAYNSLADVFYRQGMIDEAVETCRMGLVLIPDSSLLHFSLGLLLHKQGHKDAAAQELRITLELDPNAVEARRILQAMLEGSSRVPL